MPLWVKKPNTVLSAALSVLLGLGSFSLSLVEPSSVIAASSKTQQAIQENQQIYSNTGIAGVIVRPTNIRYPYGESTPTFYCAIREVCEISFLPNDRPVSRLIGDSDNWPSAWWVGMAPDGPVYHMVFKPYPTAVKTNVVIGTQNNRTYLFNLVVVPSERLRVHEYKFYDPDHWVQNLSFPPITNPVAKAIQESTKVAALQQEIKTMKSQPHALAVDPRAVEAPYKIRGSAPWKPVTVFDDGSRVFIQFPPNVNKYFMPAFFLLSRDGVTPQTTNFNRVSRTMLIVPHLFMRGELVWGSDGQDKETVKITRISREHKKPWWDPF